MISGITCDAWWSDLEHMSTVYMLGSSTMLERGIKHGTEWENVVIAVMGDIWLLLISFKQFDYLTQRRLCLAMKRIVIDAKPGIFNILQRFWRRHRDIIVYQSDFEGDSVSRRFTEHRKRTKHATWQKLLPNIHNLWHRHHFRQMFVFGDSGLLHHAPTNLPTWKRKPHLPHEV